MTDNLSLPLRQRSTFATVRLKARHLWKGPRSISWRVEDEPYFGWPVMLLQKTSAFSDLIDTRTIFANLFDTSQESALLRATFWNGDYARRAVKEQGDDYRPKVPGRFVLIRENQALSWISKFNEIQFAFSQESHDESNPDIRRLRIEKDYTSNIFEMVWQRDEPKYREVNRKWDLVWSELTEELIGGDEILNFHEDFWVSEPNFTYDFQSYRSELTNANEEL